MPLIQSKSKKALKENIATEMRANPSPSDRKRNIAIAFSVKRKNAHKKASGGTVESGSRDMNMAEGGQINAKNERRPMPDNTYDDSKMVAQNRGNKPPKNDSWTSKVTEQQAVNNSGRMVKPIKRPSMVPSNAFSTRMYDEEGNLQESSRPGPYGEQPPRHDDEEGPNRQGPAVRDMEDEHSTHRKPYAKGGQIEPSDRESHNIKMRTSMEPMDDSMEMHEREDEAHLQSMESPSEDEGSMDAHRRNEMGPDRQGPKVSDMEREHNNGRMPYADGGEIGRSPDDSEDQPEHEAMLEKHNSIAAAIMAKRDRLHAEIDSGAHDMDEAVRMADGGILSHDSIYSDESSQADLSRNHDEDANEEDQLSFNALRKENYNDSNLHVDSHMDSGEHGDKEEADGENKHDMISKIRSKMNMKRQFRVD